MCKIGHFLSASEIDPFTGWCDNINGPVGLMMVSSLGINHLINSKLDMELNMIPIDICVKGMIVASHKVWRDKLGEDISIYNAASVKFVSYESLLDSLDMIKDYPSLKAISTASVTFTENDFYAWVLRIFRNLIPALFIDGLLCITGNKPKY